jgi:hypothetical protein
MFTHVVLICTAALRFSARVEREKFLNPSFDVLDTRSFLNPSSLSMNVSLAPKAHWSIPICYFFSSSVEGCHDTMSQSLGHPHDLQRQSSAFTFRLI